MKNKIFKIYLSELYFKKGDILNNQSKSRLKVISTPNSRWYLKLLEIISFKLYKAPIYYKCKLIEDE